MPESVFRLFGDGLNPIFQQNHQNFESHHMLQINKILNKLRTCLDFEVELSTLSDLIFLMYGSNHFGFSLKQSSMYILYGKIVPSGILSQTQKLYRVYIIFGRFLLDLEIHLPQDCDVSSRLPPSYRNFEHCLRLGSAPR